MKPNTFLLPAGVEVWVRELQPDDRSKLREGFDALSAESRYLRFHTYGFNLNEAKLEYLTNVDQINHVAIGVACQHEAREFGVGIGRFIRTATGANEAELALTVRDTYQRMGIGALMLAALFKKAHAQGIDRFIVHIHAHRKPLIERLVRLGAEFRQQSHGIAELAIPVLSCKELEAADQHYLARFYQVFMA